jgi:hypothetical protein
MPTVQLMQMPLHVLTAADVKVVLQLEVPTKVLFASAAGAVHMQDLIYPAVDSST